MPENLLGMQISNFRYANMDFFKTPHIQIKFLGKNPVFKYEFLVHFSHPCIGLDLVAYLSTVTSRPSLSAPLSKS